jgi:hypothetical protein
LTSNVNARRIRRYDALFGALTVEKLTALLERRSCLKSGRFCWRPSPPDILLIVIVHRHRRNSRRWPRSGPPPIPISAGHLRYVG